MPDIQDIKNYIASKGHSDVDQQKKRFFSTIVDLMEKKELTIGALHDNLAKLGPVARRRLFYYGRGLDASHFSKAAKLIRALYKDLGLDLNLEDWKVVIQLGIPETSSFYRIFLDDALIKHLGLNRTKEKSLAKRLVVNWNGDFSTLPEQLKTITSQAANYLPQLLSDIYSLYQDNPDLKEQFLQAVIAAAVANPKLQPAVLQAGVDFAENWIAAYPQDYFKLKEAMRQQVFSRIKQDRKIYQKIHEQAKESLFLDLKEDSIEDSITSMAKAEAYLTDQENNLQDEDLVREYLSKQVEAVLIIKKVVNAALGEDLKVKASEIIKAYLAKSPGQYKKTFFESMLNRLSEEPLSIHFLIKQLNEADKDLLFAKWRGPEHSRASTVMKELYKIASFGISLDETQAHQMLYEGSLPALYVEEYERQETFIKDRISLMIRRPDKASSTCLDREILNILNGIKARATFLQTEKTIKRERAEADYQQYLVEKGLELAESANPIFDPQGHVLVFVTLNEDDYAKILTQWDIEPEPGVEKKQVEELLGTKITTSTLCNLDIGSHPSLKQKFSDWTGNSSFLDKSYKIGKSSLIALQEEMMLHILLHLRVFEKLLKKEYDESFRQQLIEKVNELVQATFLQALSSLKDIPSGTDPIAALNKYLDANRERLSAKCREALKDALLSYEEGSDISLESIVKKKLKNHDFTSTTATGMDYLRTDARNQTVVRITATDRTAHDKQLGADGQALRLLARNIYDPVDGTVKPYIDSTSDARVPSIAVLKTHHGENVPHKKAVKDVALKLAKSKALLQRLQPDYEGPVTYNLLTSLYTQVQNMSQDLKNQQRKSAGLILRGAHLYNLQQMENGNNQGFIFVQNIPVNQHGNELDDEAIDDATAEATLMANVALLSTFRHYAAVFPPQLQKSIERTYQYQQSQYQTFLPQAQSCTKYFCRTAQGQKLIRFLDRQKTDWQKATLNTPVYSFNDLVVQALFKLYSSNQHYNQQFGMLIQALSVFVEPMSQAGCKSANERYQSVAGRVELLKSISSRKPEERYTYSFESDVINALKDIVQGRGTAEQLQACLDTAYNEYNLQGSAASISEEDQGAASKVGATKSKGSGKVREINTNVAETSFLTRLFQKFSNTMQAHKAKLADAYKELFEGTSEIQNRMSR